MGVYQGVSPVGESVRALCRRVLAAHPACIRNAAGLPCRPGRDEGDRRTYRAGGSRRCARLRAPRPPRRGASRPRRSRIHPSGRVAPRLSSPVGDARAAVERAGAFSARRAPRTWRTGACRPCCAALVVRSTLQRAAADDPPREAHLGWAQICPRAASPGRSPAVPSASTPTPEHRMRMSQPSLLELPCPSSVAPVQIQGFSAGARGMYGPRTQRGADRRRATFMCPLPRRSSLVKRTPSMDSGLSLFRRDVSLSHSD